MSVFVLKLAQTTQLIGAHATVLFLPVKERGLGDAKLSANFFDPDSGLGLLECKGDLRLSKFCFFHGLSGWVAVAPPPNMARKTLLYNVSIFGGEVTFNTTVLSDNYSITFLIEKCDIQVIKSIFI
jgi:hypothetical protein